MILSRLDDMKAEETVTIDLRGKSAYSDYMIVTTGRANQGAEGNRHQEHPWRGHAQLRLGADRFRRCDRARIQTRGARILQSGKIVDTEPDGGEGDLTSGADANRPWRMWFACARRNARAPEYDLMHEAF